MKYGLVISVLLFSFQSFAQSCGTMADGETLRIDETNKSLQNFKVQDQDGLGSCYANAASLLLQGSLKDNPEISYLHLATLYKTENLANQRSSAKSSKNYDIYARPIANNNQKAINGGGDAMKWDLAMDGGNTCGVIMAVKELEAKNKRPVVCLKSEMNLEKILASGDTEHKQFRTVLESSVYMNQFQKTFGDIDEKPTFFNKKRVLEAQEKYKGFKDGFQNLIKNKQQKIAKQDCNRINADSLGSVVAPLIQMGLTYSACFKADFPSKDEYWCQVATGLVNNPKVQADGSVEIEGMNPAWLKKLQSKVTQRKSQFSVQNLSDDITETFIDGLKLDERGKQMARQFMKDRIIGKSSVNKNLEALSNEYNEVASKGFSPACVERNTYNYFDSKDYENDWKSEAGLCSYGELMKQATNVIVKYKESGLNDLNAALSFLTEKAGSNYDEALMALYATDCDDKGKVSIPESVTCQTLDVQVTNREKVNNKIIEILKSNKPLSASLCSQILKKPKDQFAINECGNHALGITGIQCLNGKFRYLIQNSWGANSRASNEVIENIDGKGAYWFDETTFFSSVYGMDYIK